MKSSIQYIFAMVVIVAALSGCKKLIAIDTPQNQLTTDKIFGDTIATNAALVNIYAQLDKTIDGNYNKYLGLYTDELTYPTSVSNDFYVSNLSTANTNVTNIWKNNYFVVYSCNDLITQLQNATAIPAASKTTMTAEAEFLRAYAYFYLVNSFNSVPLVLTTDVSQTSHLRQSDSAAVYDQIKSDLNDAQSKLPITYIGAGRVRANRWSATALLARLYLYEEDWSNAESNASAVIGSGTYMLTPSVANVFLANSTETILQCWTQNGFITDGPSLIPSSGAPVYPVSTTLLNAFENGDLRKTNWLKSTLVSGTTYYYPYKYHNRATNTTTPEYLMMLRLAEQYLIRAEARAQQGNITGAIADLNVLRIRAGLSQLPTTLAQKAALDAVNQEWRVEFCMEWGHRYLELKRTGRLNSLMSNYRSTWSAKSVLLPIPQNEVTLNSALVQNPGY
jgi:hypothetical protein